MELFLLSTAQRIFVCVWIFLTQICWIVDVFFFLKKLIDVFGSSKVFNCGSKFNLIMFWFDEIIRKINFRVWHVFLYLKTWCKCFALYHAFYRNNFYGSLAQSVKSLRMNYFFHFYQQLRVCEVNKLRLYLEGTQTLYLFNLKLLIQLAVSL